MTTIQYSPAVVNKLKKLDVRIRKSFKERIEVFEKDIFDPLLDNHPLKNDYEGLRSIGITADYRAIYENIQEGEDMIIYFLLLGTHQELYSKEKEK